MSNNRPRRAGPVWLWALILLVVLIALFVLLRRDAAAQEVGGFGDGYRVEPLVVAPGAGRVDAKTSNRLIYNGFDTTDEAEIHVSVDLHGGPQAP